MERPPSPGDAGKHDRIVTTMAATGELILQVIAAIRVSAGKNCVPTDPAACKTNPGEILQWQSCPTRHCAHGGAPVMVFT